LGAPFKIVVDQQVERLDLAVVPGPGRELVHTHRQRAFAVNVHSLFYTTKAAAAVNGTGQRDHQHLLRSGQEPDAAIRALRCDQSGRDEHDP
jgi:hypothetical protein